MLLCRPFSTNRRSRTTKCSHMATKTESTVEVDDETKAVSTVEVDDENQRVEEDSLSGGVTSLQGINDDCILGIFKFLETEDLNSLAICSRRYRKARSSPLLDQTRNIGTIVCSPNSSLHQTLSTIVVNGWNNVFSGNTTHLRVVGLERVVVGGWMSMSDVERRALIGDAHLTGVTCLKLSYPSVGPVWDTCRALALILPNLRELTGPEQCVCSANHGPDLLRELSPSNSSCTAPFHRHHLLEWSRVH